MKKTGQNIVALLAILILAGVIIYNYRLENIKKNEFNSENNKIASYAATSIDRVSNSIITLPEESTLVGLKEGVGTYKFKDGTSGAVTLEDKYLVTKFVAGVYKKSAPKLDAVAPMYVSNDSQGGSTYIVLWNDRGDTAIEKSYARLGRSDVKVQSISILPATSAVKNEEYEVDIVYKLEGISKQTGNYASLDREEIIPVVDGHFDPTHAVAKK